MNPNNENQDADAAKALIEKWARLHAARTFASVLGFLVLLWACIAAR
ncbi:MAG: DUF1772 domain-containing protein [Candidatus Acidiferrales bacterium]